jgi:putative membrane protein
LRLGIFAAVGVRAAIAPRYPHDSLPERDQVFIFVPGIVLTARHFRLSIARLPRSPYSCCRR